MKNKLYLMSLGCSKNLIDSEVLLGIVDENNIMVTDEIKNAHIIIINTCCFIDDAKEESIDAILQAAQYKIKGKCKSIIVCGCLGERYKEELIKEIPEIDAIIGTGNISDIIEVISYTLQNKKIVKTGEINNPYLENTKRLLTNNNKTSYVKIAEGCNNFCTYCIIPKLRGKYRSRNMENIIKEVKYLGENGIKEVILIAQDTSLYGVDIYGKPQLPKLLNQLNKIETIEWIRILYLYPDLFSKELINSIKNNEKVVNYVDIPIQHINNDILKRMNRNTNKKNIINLINNLRSLIKDIVIRTTLIVGFPGETQEQFDELYDFVNKMKFDRLGVFKYSKEEGTPAAKYSNQIPDNIKEERMNRLMLLQKEISYNKNTTKIGKIYKAIIEEKIPNESIYIGRTFMDSPEIDGVVYVDSKNKLNIGDFVNVKINDCLEYDLRGTLVNEFSK